MDNELYDDLALEQIVKTQFGLPVEISHVVARHIPVGPTANATVFLTSKKHLYAHVTAQAALTLGDIQKIMVRMGCVSELYVPPKGNSHYFDDIGAQKFRDVFPGRSNPLPDDIRYYRTLAPYVPALVQIHEIKNGELLQYDTDSKSNWRPAVKFAYRRIKTS